MLVRALGIALALSCFATASYAQDITSITIMDGGPAVHVTVRDQNGTAIPPANITWQTSPIVNIVPDDTGFNFSVAAETAPIAFTLSATDAATPTLVSAILTINVSSNYGVLLLYSGGDFLLHSGGRILCHNC
jgi:hypothetical protein